MGRAMPQPNPRAQPPSIGEMTSLPAAQAVHALSSRGLTLATAESLTGGGLGEAVTSVPGSSAVYAGGVVTYATRLKIDLLGVPQDIVDRHGVVSSECATAMAARVRELLGTDVGLAPPGAPGPARQEGKPVGRVYVAVADPSCVVVQELSLTGDRGAIRRATVAAALDLVVRRIQASAEETRGDSGKPGTGS